MTVAITEALKSKLDGSLARQNPALDQAVYHSVPVCPSASLLAKFRAGPFPVGIRHRAILDLRVCLVGEAASQ